MNFFYFYTAVQIIAEMAPISSSGHIALLDQIFKNKKLFNKTLYYFLHGPTLLLILFFLKNELMDFFFTDKTNLLIPFVWIALADAVILFFYYLKEKINYLLPLPVGFIITFVCLAATHFCNSQNILNNLSLSTALILGMAQSIAFAPGISRLAFTSFVGCLIGLPLYHAFFLSWLIQIPLMAAAFLKSCIEIIAHKKLKKIMTVPFLLTLLASTIVSWYMLKLVSYLYMHNAISWLAIYMTVPVSASLYLHIKRGKSCLRSLTGQG